MAEMQSIHPTVATQIGCFWCKAIGGVSPAPSQQPLAVHPPPLPPAPSPSLPCPPPSAPPWPAFPFPSSHQPFPAPFPPGFPTYLQAPFRSSLASLPFPLQSPAFPLSPFRRASLPSSKPASPPRPSLSPCAAPPRRRQPQAQYRPGQPTHARLANPTHPPGSPVRPWEGRQPPPGLLAFWPPTADEPLAALVRRRQGAGQETWAAAPATVVSDGPMDT